MKQLNDVTVMPRNLTMVQTDNVPPTSRSPTATPLRSGTTINPPDKLKYQEGEI